MIRLATCVLIGVLMAPCCQSAIVYDLFFRIGTDDAIDGQFNVQSGQQFDVEVILRESVTTPDAPNMGANGLGSFGFRIQQVGADGGFVINTRPNFQLDKFPGSDDTVGGANIFGSVVPIDDRTGGVFEGTLATVTLTAPSSGSTRFEFVDPEPGLSNFAALGAGNNIDDGSVGFRSATLSVTAIPEPSSLLFMSGLGAVLLVRRRRIG